MRIETATFLGLETKQPLIQQQQQSASVYLFQEQKRCACAIYMPWRLLQPLSKCLPKIFEILEMSREHLIPSQKLSKDWRFLCLNTFLKALSLFLLVWASVGMLFAFIILIGIVIYVCPPHNLGCDRGAQISCPVAIPIRSPQISVPKCTHTKKSIDLWSENHLNL